MDATALARQLLEPVAAHRAVGAHVLRAADGTAVVTLDGAALPTNALGAPHAGALVTLVDATGLAALLAACASEPEARRLVPLEVSATLDFRRQARGRLDPHRDQRRLGRRRVQRHRAVERPDPAHRHLLAPAGPDAAALSANGHPWSPATGNRLPGNRSGTPAFMPDWPWFTWPVRNDAERTESGRAEGAVEISAQLSALVDELCELHPTFRRTTIERLVARTADELPGSPSETVREFAHDQLSYAESVIPAPPLRRSG